MSSCTSQSSDNYRDNKSNNSLSLTVNNAVNTWNSLLQSKYFFIDTNYCILILSSVCVSLNFGGTKLGRVRQSVISKKEGDSA